METKICTKSDTEKSILNFYLKNAGCEDCNTKRVLNRY